MNVFDKLLECKRNFFSLPNVNMPAFTNTIIAERGAVGTTHSLPLELAELCLNRRRSLSSCTVTMPMQIFPSEIACAPRRFNKKTKAGNIPSGPSTKHHFIEFAAGQGRILFSDILLTTNDEIEAPAAGPSD